MSAKFSPKLLPEGRCPPTTSRRPSGSQAWPEQKALTDGNWASANAPVSMSHSSALVCHDCHTSILLVGSRTPWIAWIGQSWTPLHWPTADGCPEAGAAHARHATIASIATRERSTAQGLRVTPTRVPCREETNRRSRSYRRRKPDANRSVQPAIWRQTGRHRACWRVLECREQSLSPRRKNGAVRAKQAVQSNHGTATLLMIATGWPRRALVACAATLSSAVSMATEYRSFDGLGNSAIFPAAGVAGERVVRFGYEDDYPDQIGDVITRPGKPNPRDISNAVFAQSHPIENRRGLSDWVVHWGQFLTHDMTLIRTGAEFDTLSTGELGDFSIPITNPTDPLGPGPIPFNRSQFDPDSGDGSIENTPLGPQLVPRWQINQNTSYIDASNVYGSDAAKAASLRTTSGGRLKTSAGGLLPDQDAGGSFLAGDERANENVALTSIHALFVREHNRLADAIAANDGSLSDEEVYQRARKIVGAEMQAITYNEFLPAVIGDAAPAAADFAYDLASDASITLAFSTAAFRFGHSMQSPQLAVVNADGSHAQPLGLVEASRNPSLLSNDPSLADRLLKGLASQTAQENDARMIDELRNMLLGPPGSGVPLDLASLDIQRGRDHGLLNSYNEARFSYALPPVNSFARSDVGPGAPGAVGGRVRRRRQPRHVGRDPLRRPPTRNKPGRARDRHLGGPVPPPPRRRPLLLHGRRLLRRPVHRVAGGSGRRHTQPDHRAEHGGVRARERFLRRARAGCLATGGSRFLTARTETVSVSGDRFRTREYAGPALRFDQPW